MEIPQVVVKEITSSTRLICASQEPLVAPKKQLKSVKQSVILADIEPSTSEEHSTSVDESSPISEGQVTLVEERSTKLEISSGFERSLLQLSVYLSEEESISCEQEGTESTLLTPKSKRQKRKKKRKHSLSSPPGKKMYLRPNYFIGIQVSNPEIHRAVRLVQQRIIQQEPALCSTVIPTPKLHLTLAVFYLPDPEYVTRAAKVVKECVNAARETFTTPPVSLTFTGIKSFKNEVVFVGIKEGSALQRVNDLAIKLETSLQAAGLSSSSKKAFRPHLTLMKLSKDFTLRRKACNGLTKIPESLYSDMANHSFGVQTVRGVQLLSMNKPKDISGYYYCSHQENFDVECDELNDHSECCKPLFSKEDLGNTLKQNICVPRPHTANKRGIHTLQSSDESLMCNKISSDLTHPLGTSTVGAWRLVSNLLIDLGRELSDEVTPSFPFLNRVIYVPQWLFLYLPLFLCSHLHISPKPRRLSPPTSNDSSPAINLLPTSTSYDSHRDSRMG
uniref:A-kinase anchor protein 7-like phosphoesterase domain-containing protein n=1 Tax=Timema bartmani TaxID=61472 RepID=A0A7R9F183_9NEOP|nr:unnamed protein product [Timema bartmani]